MTRFLLSNAGNRANPVPLAFFTTVEHGASRDNHIADCTFANFEIDGSAVALADYHYLAKGLGLQYVLRGHASGTSTSTTPSRPGSAATSSRTAVIDAVVAVGCGREDNGVQWGGAGIGVGIGGWGPVERLDHHQLHHRGQRHQRHLPGAAEAVLAAADRHPDHRLPLARATGSASPTGERTGWSSPTAPWSATSRPDSTSPPQGTVGVAGRGGILSDCLIDGNVHDGIRIGNTPGPYMVRGNRISRNGRHGYRQDELGRGYRAAAHALVVESNDIWGNGLDGILIERAMTDGTVVGNRIRDNGRQCAPAAAGSGETVSYTATTLTDTAAYWEHDGHRGKLLEVQGHDVAVVVGNTATELRLAPVRRRTRWSPSPGRCPRPARRTGCRPRRRSAPGWPSPRPCTPRRCGTTGCGTAGSRRTQTHGIWVGERGSCVACRVENNDLADNAVAATWLQTPPVGGRWAGNLDDQD